MILSDNLILENLKSGSIVIEPFNVENLNPCSVDLTIAPDYKVYSDEILDVRQPNKVYELKMEGHGVLLEPGRVYLYRCNERIGCKGNIRGKVEGKSSLGRLGLFVHVTAGFIDPGFEGSLVLELVATQRVRIYPNMKICQIEFAYVQGEIAETYDLKAGSKYHGQVGVQESKYHLNFKNKHMAQQTAVEWLEEKMKKLTPPGYQTEISAMLEQAKQMEKEQIKQNYNAGLFDGEMDIIKCRIHKDAEQYYNETYGNEGV